MIPRLHIHFSLHDQWRFWFGKHFKSYKDEQYLLNHSRSGLILALHSALPNGGRVGVMIYNCHTVMNAIVQAGCEIVFLDVNDNLQLDLSKSQISTIKGLDAIVVTHLFGIHNDVQSLRTIAPHLLIIEDCAHAYGISADNIKGDFATYSIGQGKLPSIGDGGILVVNKKQCIEDGYEYAIDKLKQLYAELPEYTIVQQWNLFLRMVAMSWLYTPLIYTYFTKPCLKRDSGVKSVHNTEIMCKMAQGIKRLYMSKVPAIKNQISQQQLNAQTLQRMLIQQSVTKVLVGTNAFMLVTICERPKEIKNCFKQMGIEAETHFKYCIDWAEQFGYRRGTCLQAEQLVQKILIIPTYKIQ